MPGAQQKLQVGEAEREGRARRPPPPLTPPTLLLSGKLYCGLTCHVINGQPDAVRRHLGGKKFVAAKAAAAAGELEPTEEPDLPSDEGDEAASGAGEEEEEVGASDGGAAAPPPAKAKAEPAAKARAARPTRPKRARRVEA